MIYKNFMFFLMFILMCSVPAAYSAISLDRTRVIFDGNQSSTSMTITNENKKLPYLAQAWLEDSLGTKDNSKFAVLPPLQRVEPGTTSQIKIEKLSLANELPQDRESVYYFNLREIPPRTEKSNTLQIALQTRIKMFYRPNSIAKSSTEIASLFLEKISLTRKGDVYEIINQTPYYFTISDAATNSSDSSVKGFKPFMISPFSQGNININAQLLGDEPVLTYIDDYGGRDKLKFSCRTDLCTASEAKQD